MNDAKTLLFVANVDWFFQSHRQVLAQEALRHGYRVVVAATDTGRLEQFRKLGMETVDLHFERSGTHPVRELFTLYRLIKLYRSVKPDLVHHITLKPVIYGSLAARLLGIPKVNAVSGLGYNFNESRTGWSTRTMTGLMRIGFKPPASMIAIFQNGDDLETMRQRKVIVPAHRIERIKGAGVDLDQFSPSDRTREVVHLVLPARMLWDKGIREFKQASELLKEECRGKAVFKLAGRADPDNRAGADPQELEAWQEEGYFEWLGHQEDMAALLRESDVVVLPSYREGMPKSLLEAAAAGLPIVTTDAIGCRECVDEGENGLKVPVRDAHALARAMRTLILEPDLRRQMGAKGRIKAEAEFDVRQVVHRHMEIYARLLG